MKTVSFALVGGMLLAAAGLGAQAPAFDVVSVKRHPGSGGSTLSQLQPGGRFKETNVSLDALMREAYQVPGFRLVGAPAWASTERYDINAKGAGDVPLMMRSMLAERFKLAVHTENRELPIYALALARSDGTLGPRLARSTLNCATSDVTVKENAKGKEKTKSPVKGDAPLSAAGKPAKCGVRMDAGAISARGASLAQVVALLTDVVDRTVVDRSGLTGSFDFDLRYTPDQPAQRAAPGPAKGKKATIDPSGPSIFTALQEQLGLKLESAKGPVAVLVIDSIQHPTED